MSRSFGFYIPVALSSLCWCASAHGQNHSETAQVNDHFHISVLYGTGQLSLEVDGNRSLSQEPPFGVYEDQQPVTGSYQSGSTRFQRTTFSYLFNLGQRTMFTSIGLENLKLGSGGTPLIKSGGTEAEFQLNSMVFEIGATRRLSVFSQAKGSISYDQFLDGKLRSRYLLRTAAQSGGPRYTVIEDHVSGGGRLNLTGAYYLNISPGLSAGIQVSGQYGILRFRERGSASAIFGYTMGLSLVLRL
ncbi:MAG: hypothetical protein ACOH5I_12350 [Oligoflexus sp.]